MRKGRVVLSCQNKIMLANSKLSWPNTEGAEPEVSFPACWCPCLTLPAGQLMNIMMLTAMLNPTALYRLIGWYRTELYSEEGVMSLGFGERDSLQHSWEWRDCSC